MLINKKYLAIAAALILTFLAGRFATPAKVQIKEVEKIVYQQDKTKDTNQDVKETIKEVKLPNGTTIKETIREKETVAHTESVDKMVSQTVQTVENRPSYRLSLDYQPPIPNFQATQYAGALEFRLLGEFYVGPRISTDKNNRLGVVLSFGF